MPRSLSRLKDATSAGQQPRPYTNSGTSRHIWRKVQRLLLNPGPTNTTSYVRQGLVQGDFSHRDPEVRDSFVRVKQGLLEATGGMATHECVLFAGSGTSAAEAIIASLHGHLLIVVNGRYSQRLATIAERYSIPMTCLSVDPYTAVSPADIAAQLDKDPTLTHVVLVHHETTTGMLVPLREIGQVVAARNKLLVVDAVSSVGAHDFDLVLDNVAFCSLNPNKSLEALPGIGIVLARTSELDNLEGKARSFYLDLFAQAKRGRQDQFPFTMPVQILFALDNAIKQWLDEGIDKRIRRYKLAAEHMRSRLTTAGFELLGLPRTCSGNIITTIQLPKDVDFPSLVLEMRERGYTIYSNLDSVASGRFFVATMGSITCDDIERFVEALRVATASHL